MTESRTPLDAALDLLVFVPVGLAVTAAEEIPKLAAKGRTRVTNQLTMARVVGQFAVTRGRQELDKRLSPPPRPAGPQAKPEAATEPPRASHGSGLNGSVAAASVAADQLPGADRVSTNGAITVSEVDRPADPSPVKPGGPAPDAGSLAIPGYDSLSASQVVQRLAGLRPDELEAVGAYERAHRGRRTILNRIDQLQGR